MKSCKAFPPRAHREGLAYMSIEIALEDIAIGEADLATASKTISTCLKQIDDDIAHELYGALRAWLWKALEARRRDEDLSGWIDIIGRVSSHLSDRWNVLAIKLDGFAELLQASIMLASAPQRRDLMSRKHVREMLSTIYIANGRLKRQTLVQLLGLKDANLTRVAAPLQDEGWIQREVVGRDVFYRLTEKGKSTWLPIIALQTMSAASEIEVESRPQIFKEVHLDAWKGAGWDRFGTLLLTNHYRSGGAPSTDLEDKADRIRVADPLIYETVKPTVVNDRQIAQVMQ